MDNVYVYYGSRKEMKKIQYLAYSMNGLSWISAGIDDYCALKLSSKLERRLKLLTFDVKRPRKITFLYNIISKSRIYTESKYKKKWENDMYNRPNKWYSDNSYKKMPKGITKDNQNDYNSKNHHQSGTGKSFCTKCHFTHKSFKYPMFINKGVKRYSKDEDHCPNCGAQKSFVWLHSSVRVPKKNANKKVWKNFYKLFIDIKH